MTTVGSTKHYLDKPFPTVARSVKCPKCDGTIMVEDGCYKMCFQCGYDEKKVDKPSVICTNCGKPVGLIPDMEIPAKCPYCSQESITQNVWQGNIVTQVNTVTQANITEAYFKALTEEAFALWQKKNISYGPYNISVFGLKGIAVRMFDKMQRVLRLVWHSVDNPLDETIQDTFLDLAVYALIAILVIRNQWPKSPFEVEK